MFKPSLIVVFILCFVIMSLAIYFYGRRKNDRSKQKVYVARAIEGCRFDESTRIRLTKVIEQEETK